ncbi:MAG: hypothetical protein VKK04_13990 [Synechococcales bacterium]|nr:hypothetical protein [Synechococcales bacterium]
MHRDHTERYRVQTIKTLAGRKRLGSYLVDAGLITDAQVSVALNDQQATGMRFGEVLATRGWVKQQTIEYLMTKIIIPERQAAQEQASAPSAPELAPSTPAPTRRATEPAVSAIRSRASSGSSGSRREIPISKPLPSVPSPDGDVNWVG